MPRGTRGRTSSRNKTNQIPPATSSINGTMDSNDRCRSKAKTPIRRTRRARASRTTPLEIDLSSCDIEESPMTVQPLPQSRLNVRRARQRPTVISLDVTYSSDELEDVIMSSPEPPRHNDALDFALSPGSPEKSQNLLSPQRDNSLNDSESDKEIVEPNPTDVNVKRSQESQDILDSDSEEEDLFYEDYKLKKDKVFAAALQEMKAIEEENTTTSTAQEPELLTNDENQLDKSGEFDLSDLGSPIELRKRKVKKSKALQNAQECLKKLTEELSKNQANNSFDEVCVVSDNEDDLENEVVTLYVKWESNYIRMPVRQFQKLSSVYEEIANRFSLNVAQIVLCHNDKVIKGVSCPKDLNLKFGDIIEGGVQVQPCSKVKDSIIKHSADSIPLKVQNANKKEAVTIYIGRKAKMAELMHRYAEDKNLKLENLNFKFDGDQLDPTDTPETLDLEGDECIDVYCK